MGIFTFENMISAVRLNGLTESFLPPMILNMSITASVMILFVLLARLALKKAPKIFSYALWAVVLFRLLCPVSITTDFSLLGLFDTPAVENTQHTTAMEYIPYDVVHTPDLEVQPPVPPVTNDVVNETLPQEHAALGADPLEGEFAIGSFVWLLGIAGMAIYSAVSYFLLRRKLVGAVLLRDNIYLADGISSPFVMGFIRPKIYLPSVLSEQEQSYIILHEQHHIRRGDHIIKALAFIALCIHWFNPLVWVAFVLSSKDMEMSCDEAVVKKLGEGIRADYSASLLSLATGRHIIAGTPLAFGEGDTKSRIKNMLNWKKPKTWIMLVALSACVVAIVFCATNPRNDTEENSMVVWETKREYPKAVVDIVNDYVMQQVAYYNDLGSGENAIGGEYSILEVKVVGLERRYNGMETESHRVELYRLKYRLLPSEPDHVVLAGGMQMEDGWITEYGSTGQPYLAILCDSSSGEETWTLIGMTNTNAINLDYNTDEMKAKYADRYAAAALELYKAYLDMEAQASYGTASDVSYYLELAAGESFRNMALDRQNSLLVEYEDLLDDYTLMARETEDGKTAYIVGQYNGDPTQSPLYGMYSAEVSLAEDEGTFQFLYPEEESETVEAVLAASKKEFPPSAGYRIEASWIHWSANSGLILIQPKDNALFLDVPWNRYLHTPNGREYIVDAVSRGIDVCGRTDTFLYVYLISERFGEIAERIALTEAEAQAILTEERVSITEGFGFSATLHIDGQTTYFNERKGVPQSVLDMAVEKCGYQFADPSYITDTIREARLDCDWLDTPLYASEEDLPRLREILKNAQYDFVGACGYGAKLTLTFTGGEKLTVFKGCDSCDSIVFGSYGGYFIGDKENIEFWKMFGLDPDTKERIETNPAEDAENEIPVNPVTHSQKDLDGTIYNVQSYLHAHFRNNPNTYRTDILYLEPDLAESARAAVRYFQRTDELAVSDPTRAAQMIAVKAVYFQDWFLDTDSNQKDAGLQAKYFYVLPNEVAPNYWYIHDKVDTAIPEDIGSPVDSSSATSYITIKPKPLGSSADAAIAYLKERDSFGGSVTQGKSISIYNRPGTLCLVTKDGRVGELPLPYADEALNRAEAKNIHLDANYNILCYEAEVEKTVRDQATGSSLSQAGKYRFIVDLETFTCAEIFTRTKEFSPEDIEFTGLALDVTPDEMTYEERLAWAQLKPYYEEEYTPTGRYIAGEGCIACLCTYLDGPNRGTDVIEFRFADGTLAKLPLPLEGFDGGTMFMRFENGTFIYEKKFTTEKWSDDGQTLIHFKGTYHYEVDLAAKTVSLTVIQ